MKHDEIFNLTDKWLKSVPGIRERIRLIDIALKKGSYDMDTIEKLKQERHRLKFKLSKIIRAVATLNDVDQKIICYRYFEGLTYKETGWRVGISERTVYRRSKKLVLDIGRVMFGFEDEFWIEIDEFSIH